MNTGTLYMSACWSCQCQSHWTNHLTALSICHFDICLFFQCLLMYLDWSESVFICQELTQNPQFFVGGASRFDVQQGELGNILACILTFLYLYLAIVWKDLFLLALLLLLFIACRRGGGEEGFQFLSQHELRPSVGPVLNPYPYNGVSCVCAEVSAYACAYACVVSSLCPVYFNSLATLHPHVHNTGHPVSTDPYRPGVSRPVKSHSYRHSGRTDSTHHCCYECYQRSQFTEDNTNPLSCPRLTPCVSSQSPEPSSCRLCQPHLCGRGSPLLPALTVPCPFMT